MADLTPDAIAQRSFRSALRGFDQSEVREFLRQLAERLDALAAERDNLAATLQAAGPIDLQHEIEVTSKEIHSVLEAARSAAETMRERAAAEVARWRSEAIAEAEKTRREAQADAEHLRTDAWTTSEALLKQSQRESDRILGESEKESMRLVGEAEREAHRTLGAGRREAEETVRTARMEAEKLVMDARAAHDEIIETANRKAEIAQERTRALEERRDELRRELDSVRAAIASVESELDERREALGLTEVADAAPSGERDGDWVPGETVRVVRPGHQEHRTGELPVVSEPRPMPDPTPELRVLSPEELRSRQQARKGRSITAQGEEAKGDDVADDLLADDVLGESPAVPDTPGQEPEPEPGPEPEPEGDAESEQTMDEAVESMVAEPIDPDPEAPAPHVTHPQPRPAVRSSGAALDEVEGLFARLRQPVTAEDIRGGLEPEPVRDDADGSDGLESAPDERPDSIGAGIDPFELRDSLLLPIANRALRNLKRQLTEEQNAALESLRIAEAEWEPDADDLESGVRPDLVVLVAESHAAGHAAAEQLSGSKHPRPATPESVDVSSFARSLTAELAKALADGRAHEHGARQLGSDVSRVFRAWRTDESERRVRQMSHAMYNRGLAASLEGTELRWVVSGRGCAMCRERGGRVAGDELPPAHDGCGCTVAPAG